MLLGEYLCFAQGDQERMDTLLNALTPEKLPTATDHPAWRAIWYAGDLLTLYRRAFPSETSSSDKEINTGLHRLVMKGALSHPERASAADTLDELGHALNDLFTFVPISDFFISKYPVTNVQYERFLKPENFRNKDLWCNFPRFDENSQPMKENWRDEAWNWLQKALQENDDVQDGVLLPRTWRDPRFGIARRGAPVVGISWYEANAYCSWLKENWDEEEENKNPFKPREVRLPTEKEWASAAGGEEPENRFAWGMLKDEKEITRFANTSESGINRTTPVWMYPLGASPHKYSKDRDYPSLRGGSWGSDLDYARVSFRDVLRPYLGFDLIGFRVVSLPSG